MVELTIGEEFINPCVPGEAENGIRRKSKFYVLAACPQRMFAYQRLTKRATISDLSIGAPPLFALMGEKITKP